MSCVEMREGPEAPSVVTGEEVSKAGVEVSGRIRTKTNFNGRYTVRVSYVRCSRV